jgi:hypothetical protein
MLHASGEEVHNMPMPYAHFVLAERVAQEANLPITDKAEYYIGAFYPDIRYFTKQPREKYHFAVDKLKPYELANNVPKDFLLGYKVHLLIDEVWEYPELKEVYKQAFPVLIRSRMTRGLQALAFEMYCLELPIEAVKLKPVENSLTKDLGVQTSEIAFAVNSMQKYMDAHSLESAYVMAEEAQLFPEARLKTVKGVLERMKNPLIRMVANGVVKRASSPMLPRVVSEVVKRLELPASIPKAVAKV